MDTPSGLADLSVLAGPIPCILLAAGGSRRMGSHKLLLSIGGEPMVRRTARIALRKSRPLIVVTGFGRAEVEAALAGLEDITFVHNPEWAAGMVGSAVAGIRVLPDGCQGFFLHHADMPFVDEGVFAALRRAAVERQRAGGAPLAIVAGRKGAAGHPVYFPASYTPGILALEAGERLKSVLDERGSLIVETGCDGILEDIDVPEDLDFLTGKYGQAPLHSL